MTPELDAFIQHFERYRAAMAEALNALPAAALNWRPPLAAAGEAAATNTPAAIAAHVAGSQRYWIGEVLGGQAAHRDRDAEFRAAADDTATALAHLDGAAEVVRTTLAALTPESLDRTVVYNQNPVSGRWLILRMLGHTAEHWGELMLVQQLWEASQ